MIITTLIIFVAPVLETDHLLTYIIVMNKLDPKTRKLIVRCLVEGQSIRATARTADVSKNTVTKLLVDAGRACAEYQDKALRGLPCRRIQVDEIWSFIYAKEKNVARAKAAPAEAGDVWTWTAIDAETKLVPSWRIGDRSGETAIDFMDDLRSRLANRVQLTSDGLKAYLEAVRNLSTTLRHRRFLFTDSFLLLWKWRVG